MTTEDERRHLPILLGLLAIPFGIAGATMQSLTPNELRGRITALYLLILSVVAGMLGPLVPALITDFIFGGKGTQVGISLAAAVTFFGLAGALAMAIAFGSRHGRRLI